MGHGAAQFFFRGLFAHFAPPRCRFCRTALLEHQNPYLCSRCAASVAWIGDGACRGCGFPAGPHARLGDSCDRCRGRKLDLTAAAAVVRYRGAARSLVLALKFGGETELARPLAGLMAERLEKADLGSADLLLPVVLHPKRRRKRGFDQSELLCRHLSRETGLPIGLGLVKRVRHTVPQATLRREARRMNIVDAFVASPRLAGRRLILVDDVMTTGATIGECARACREAGAARVYGLVFAR